MPDILHRIGITATPEQVFAALATPAGVAGWWSKETSGDAATLSLRFRDPSGREIGAFELEVLAREPGRRVHWRVTSGPADWIGTKIVFELSSSGPMTIVRFAHRGWAEASESMAHCSTKWATFMLSLRDLVERGQGRPAPADLKIDDWN